MSRKRRRRRRRAGPARSEAPAERGADAKGAEAPRRRGFLQPREAVPSPYPPLGVSLARGMRAVGASPLILGLAFLATLAAWGTFAAAGADPSPRVMVNLMALPPVHVYFDVVLVTAVAESTPGAAGLVLGIGAARSLVLGLLALFVVGAVRTGAPDLRASIRRLPRVAAALFLLFSAEVAVVLTVPVLVQAVGGPALGLLGILGTLVLGLHFLVLAPVIAAVEEGPSLEAIRRSVRAARLPGPRHLLLVVAYFSFVFWASTITPTEALAPATPSVLTWAFALLATFVHAGVLGALALRWLAVRDQVPASVPRSGGRR